MTKLGRLEERLAEIKVDLAAEKSAYSEIRDSVQSANLGTETIQRASLATLERRITNLETDRDKVEAQIDRINGSTRAVSLPVRRC